MAVASVVIPAHNEAATIGRHLAALRMGMHPDDLDVVVVCNGCTDGTAEVARRADPRATVIEIAQPSKAEAVRVGNAATRVFPRVHMDADIELTGAAVRQLLAPIAGHEVLATAPRRAVPRRGCSPWVRWYYDVWEALPQVESALFGRGVVVLSAQAEEQVARLSQLTDDDLGMSAVLHRDDRRIVKGAVAVIHPPRSLRQLVRRRARILTGNSRAADAGVRDPASRTTVLTLVSLAVSRPGFALRLPVFLGVHVAARVLAHPSVRRG